ncbi:MAG: hypothetical protein Q8N23_28525 [Archangium sp.]|nr:hypothetical protein [Archangium sp.]MDP3156651.1 hypothetical protein [Archangium sp.]MDP3570592.1 hypothetical protein [Archangium sp.]
MPGSVATSFSATSPGLVVSDLAGDVGAYLALCGQALKSPIHLSRDIEFSCLGALNGTTETARVWVQPLPAGWDATAACARSAKDREFYDVQSFAPADAGVDAGVLAAEPAATWAQGSDEATWRRDISPCGGVVSFDVTLAVP